MLLTDAYAVFARARQYIEAARYPGQLAYGVTIAVSKRGTTSAAHYHSYYDSTNGAIRVIGESDEELAHPYTPHGIDTYLNLFGSGKGVPLSAPQRTFDFLGVPVLAPNYSFGIAPLIPHEAVRDDNALVDQIRREFHDPAKRATASTGAAGIKTIASVESIKRTYSMRLSGMKAVNGHDDYHLLLHPLREPERYRLRQMWIDAASFAVDRLVTQGNFVFGGVVNVPWTISFRQIGGAPYIESERTATQFAVFRHAYDSATITFENIAPATIPAYMRWSRFAPNPETGVPPLLEPL